MKAKRAISEANQNWLDGAANLVDEVCVLEVLESAPDYETSLGKLIPRDQMVVDELKKLEDGESDVQVGKKCTHECHFSWQRQGTH